MQSVETFVSCLELRLQLQFIQTIAIAKAKESVMRGDGMSN